MVTKMLKGWSHKNSINSLKSIKLRRNYVFKNGLRNVLTSSWIVA